MRSSLFLVAVAVGGCGSLIEDTNADGSGTSGSGTGSDGGTSTGTADGTSTGGSTSEGGSSTGPEPVEYQDEIVEGPDLENARASHMAVLLGDGNVFVAGGYDTDGPLDSIELFRPVEGDVIDGGTLRAPRSHSCAVKLQDGRVFVAGGEDANTEIWDPSTHATQSGPPLNAPAGSGILCMLTDDGAVLVADSNLLGKGYLFERWVPGAAGFEELDSETPLVYQGGHDGALIGDPKKVLLVGGGISWLGPEPPPPGSDLGGAQVYDLTSSTYQRIEGWDGQGTILVEPSGDALVFQPDAEAFTAARFHADDESFEELTPAGAFDYSSAVAMRWDGLVVLAGGFQLTGDPPTDAIYQDTVRVWDPVAAQITAVANLTQARSHASATRLRDGTIALIGGVPGSGEVSAKIDIYR